MCVPRVSLPDPTATPKQNKLVNSKLRWSGGLPGPLASSLSNASCPELCLLPSSMRCLWSASLRQTWRLATLSVRMVKGKILLSAQ